MDKLEVYEDEKQSEEITLGKLDINASVRHDSKNE